MRVRARCISLQNALSKQRYRARYLRSVRGAIVSPWLQCIHPSSACCSPSRSVCSTLHSHTLSSLYLVPFTHCQRCLLYGRSRSWGGIVVSALREAYALHRYCKARHQQSESLTLLLLHSASQFARTEFPRFLALDPCESAYAREYRMEGCPHASQVRCLSNLARCPVPLCLHTHHPIALLRLTGQAKQLGKILEP